MGPDFSMNAGAIHATQNECCPKENGEIIYQTNIPRLWEAHRGFRVLQSAHRSVRVKRMSEGNDDSDSGGRRGLVARSAVFTRQALSRSDVTCVST